MKSTKRINPRRIPVSQADINKAKEEVRHEAAAYAFAIMFSVLRDKHEASIDELQQFWREVTELSQSISEDRVSVSDLLHVLKEEAGIVLLKK